MPHSFFFAVHHPSELDALLGPSDASLNTGAPVHTHALVHVHTLAAGYAAREESEKEDEGLTASLRLIWTGQ